MEGDLLFLLRFLLLSCPFNGGRLIVFALLVIIKSPLQWRATYCICLVSTYYYSYFFLLSSNFVCMIMNKLLHGFLQIMAHMKSIHEEWCYL